MANGIRTGDPHGFNKGRSSKFRVSSLFDKHLKKVGGHIDLKVVEITIKMKTIVRKSLMLKKEIILIGNLSSKFPELCRKDIIF